MKAFIQQIASQLEAAYPKDEAESLAWWIAEELTGLSRSQLICGYKGTTNFPNTQDIVERLLHFEPIQYIFGHTLWCGLDLKVTPATLIPRPETAELVERVERLKVNDERSKVLDVGTGSGCIAIALKKAHPEWQITGIDISSKAIEVARENACKNKVEVEFIQKDIFSDSIGHFDIIVSNPPYIRESEKVSMRPNVLDHEPSTALFVPDEDPLKFYRRIAELKSGRHLFFEINEAFGKDLADMLGSMGYTDIHLTKDIYGKDRIIEGRMA